MTANTRQSPGHAVRKEIIALHRQIYRRNQRRINESVHGYTDAFRQYEKRYARGVRRYARTATLAELEERLAQARMVYVGDYHTLPQSQRALLRLLRRLPPERPVTLALEFVLGEHQAAVLAYMRGELDDAEFLRQIDHQRHWMFDGWESFRPIFEMARERGYRVLGIDAMGKGAAGKSLTARDAYAARRIRDARRQRPDDLYIVFIGQLHIAAEHLPKLVEPGLIIHQNCHEVYWQLEAQGLEHETELVQIRENEYCLINTPPIVCQQSFLNWVDVDSDGQDDVLGVEAPAENFRSFAQAIADFFSLPLGDALHEVEVATVVDLSFLSRLRRRGDFSTQDMREIRKQILRSGSYYIPRARMVYLGNLSVNHASEEATHFLRHVCAENVDDPKLLIDAFYSRAIEEAVGFLGSKVINPKRKAPHLPTFQKLARSPRTEAELRTLARLFVKHVRMEEGESVRDMSDVYTCSADIFNGVTHLLGYRLGERLYFAMVQGDMEKPEIRDLFFESLEEEGAAISTYLYLVTRLSHLEMPERF